MRSLARTLLFWTLGALGTGSLLLVLVAYAVTLSEMNEVMDHNLYEVAESIARHQLAAGPPLPVARNGPAAREPAVSSPPPDDGGIVTQVWAGDGTALIVSQPPLPFRASPGPGTVMIDGAEWRSYVLADHGLVVQAAQRTDSRKVMAGEAASTLLLPLVLLALLIGALLALALRRGLRPLAGATAHIADRSATSLLPIRDAELPSELGPLVNAFNGLMERLANAFAMQRRFVADAAHELRTPVTALHLQLQLLERAPGGAERQEALAELGSGVRRMERLVEQLLQLSRSHPEADSLRPGDVALDELVRLVVGDFSRLAAQRGIDLGACAATPVVLQQADADQLRTLLNNLVRNALHYCPPGSRVDVTAACEGGRALLEVLDNGPGIAPADQGRVFDRFYRGSTAAVRTADPAGSGLGLAIVKAIAERHGAEVALDTPAGGGLRVRVVFPARS